MKQMPAAIFVLPVLALGLAGVVLLGNSQNIRGADRVYLPLGGASPQLVLPVK